MRNVVYHVYTISINQGKKKTIAYVDNEYEAEELCKEHILYAYEVVDLVEFVKVGKPQVCVNY